MFKKTIIGLLLFVLMTSCMPASANPSTPTPSTLPGTLLPSPILLVPAITTTLTSVPEIRIEKADLALWNGDYVKAQIEYKAVLASTTDPAIRVSALWGLGRTDMQAGNNSKALDEFSQIIADHPDSIHRAHAHFLRGEIFLQLERYTEAVEAYSAYLSIQPGLLDNYVYERRGDAYVALGNFSYGIKDYQLALDSQHIRDDSSIKTKLARTYEKAGDKVTALAMYQAIAGASQNDFIKAQMDLLSGQLCLSIGQIEEAYAYFLHSVDNYPLAYDSYSALVALVNAGVPVDDLNRGLVDYYAGQYGYAVDAFSRYAVANPDNDGSVYYYRALALRKIGLSQEAVDAFTFFIDNYADNRYWQAAWEEKTYTLWDDLAQQQLAVEAMLGFSQRTSNPSAIPQALLTAGRIYEDAGLLEQAASTWESIANSYPGSEFVPLALFWAGIVRYRSGDYEKALATFQRDQFFSLNDDDLSRAIFWSGKTQLALSNIAAATDSFQRAAAINSTGYYSLRAQDILINRGPFSPFSLNPSVPNMIAERAAAETWLRVTFSLPPETNLSSPGTLATDLRFLRGTELWKLGLPDESRLEFENLLADLGDNAADSYRLGNHLLSIGLFRPAIFAMRQVLSIAGVDEQLQTLGVPRYFNLIRYGFYFQDLIEPAGKQYGFDPIFLFSVMRQESLYDKNAGSHAGALGLMQIWPPTGQSLADQLGWPTGYTTSDLFRPTINIGLGVYFLASNRKYYEGDLYAALAQYNSTPGFTMLWKTKSNEDMDLFLEVIPISLETRDYIISIYEIYAMYQYLYGMPQ